MTRALARRIQRQVSRRGYALLFFALLGFAFGYSLAAPRTPQSPTNTFAASIMPLWTWAALWITTAVVCLFYAFRRRDRIAFSLMMGTTTAWGLVSLGGSVTAHNPRGWVGAAVFLGMASWIYIISGWPDEPRDRGPSS